MKEEKELRVVKSLIGIYNRSVLTKPEEYGSYLVKTNKGDYDIAKYDRKGWHLQANKDSETIFPIAWSRLPVTAIKK